MDLMPITEIRQRLQDRRLVFVAHKCGLSYPTVKRVADGDEGVHLNTIVKLSAYLRANP
jgi:hypothetical protein